MQLGEPEKAVAALKKALKWDPDFVQALATLSSARLALGDVEGSIDAARRAVEKQPAFAPAWNNLSLACFEQGDFEEARACANKAVELGFDVRPEYLEDLDRACAAGAQG